MAKKELKAQITEIFRILHSVRNHAGLRLEPLVAPYFTYFLSDILGHDSATTFEEIAAPELPLRNSIFSGNNDDNYSKKVDYFALQRDSKTPLLIELKTDSTSINKSQLMYLNDASTKPSKELINNVIDLAIANAKNRNRKYLKKHLHLISHLYKMHLFDESIEWSLSDVFDEPFRWSKLGIKGEKLGRLKTCNIEAKPDVLIIVPRKEDQRKLKEKLPEWGFKKFESISFGQVASIVESAEGKQDLGRIFAKYLRDWEKEPAGTERPE